jgi:hypothetical protein
VCFVAAMLLVFTTSVDAHKPITSRYTYNEDVFPIFRDRCGRCHIAGGVGPMSLVTYKDAFPWAESIRGELLADKMPPWHADQGLGAGRDLLTLLSPRDLDVMLVWVTGGTPQGNAAKTPPRVELENEWRLGPPDLVLQPSEPLTLAPAKQEDTIEFTVPSGLTRERAIRAVDLRPGNPAIVRDAEIRWRPLSSGSGATPALRTSTSVAGAALAQWGPGVDPSPFPRAKAIRLPAGALIDVRIHYKRTWTYEGVALTDRSSVGLYFVPQR